MRCIIDEQRWLRDVGLQVEPESLDAIGLPGVGRQEVQRDRHVALPEAGLHADGVVSVVVVEHEMDSTRRAVATLKHAQAAQEEIRVLATGLDHEERAAVEC